MRIAHFSIVVLRITDLIIPMDVNEITNELEARKTERVTVALTQDVYAKLELIWRKKKKRPSTLVRELIEEFVEQNREFFETAS